MRLWVGLVTVLALVTIDIGAASSPSPASASPVKTSTSFSDFQPGNIIADELFYDSTAMSAAEIQSFLDSKIGTCQNSNCLNVATVPYPGRSREVSSSTGNLICSAISAGTMKASELIYRAQVACGISAKVILVTLQKEQGLVLKTAPTDSALRWAMGMACPDTAPCDSAFAGLGSQIVTGTRQLKVYKAARFARQPGSHFIGFNPNSSCGGTTVNVENYATAALYNYTPYQPNSAALANPGGMGDSCSSYGNRNFVWFYTQWFGPTTEIPCTVNPSRNISRYWTERGSALGPLGSLVSPGIVAGVGGITVGYFTNGNVYCALRVGPLAVLGDMRDKYVALGAAGSGLSAPVSERVAYSAGGVTGYLQEFQRGTMLSATTTGTYAVLHGPMREAWGNRGGSGGTLGWPTGDQQTVALGVMQQFQNGLLMIPTGRTAIVLNGDIGAYWATGSNAATLGSTIGAPVAWTAGGVTGSYQVFERGMVMSSSTTGTFAVLNGAMRDAWGNLGGSGGSLGWPTADQESTSGGFRQGFQGGTLYASASGAGATLMGDIAAYWAAGANADRLGYPTSPSRSWVAGGVSGTLQEFEYGLVLSSVATGTFAVLHGPMRDAWGNRGGSGGSLGWPIGDAETGAGGTTQQFERGALTVPLANGLTGAIAAYWTTGGNASRLGTPIALPIEWTASGVSGTYQVFQRGMVMSSTETGTFAVLNGGIRDIWGDLGGSGGSLGWPTADRQAVSGGIRQQFQNGFVMMPTNGAAVALSGAIGTYWATGGNASRLGTPTASPIEWTAGGVSGTYQVFQRGMVMSSTATGTFAVLNGAIRAAWGDLGGSGGSLGWPIADQEPISGAVRQQFQNGTVIVPTHGVGIALFGPIGTYWSTGSNAALLGLPKGSTLALAGSGVTGSYQVFERGMVLSSTATGTFAVLNGPIRNAWGDLGGSGGSLGWPTSAQEPNNGGVMQHFHLGTLMISADGERTVLAGEYFTYWSAGSNASILGQPIASLIVWSASGVSGSYQVFEKAMVLSSETTGTYAVLDGPIRDAWGALSGSRGVLGWPIEDQKSVPEGMQQQFQHGAVVVPTTGDAYVVMD